MFLIAQREENEKPTERIFADSVPQSTDKVSGFQWGVVSPPLIPHFRDLAHERLVRCAPKEKVSRC